jgi:hypothetical protein
MDRFVFYEGVASGELLEARSRGEILELLKKYGLPHKEYAYGEVPISFEFEEEAEYEGFIIRTKLSGRVRAHVDLGLVLLEKYYKGECPVVECKCYDASCTVQEFSEMYAIQRLLKKLSLDEIEAVKAEVRDRLSNVMTIEKETNTWTPFYHFFSY